MADMDDPNPLFLHPYDNPGVVLVSHPLSGDNYVSWHKVMTMTPIGKNKFGFVDGSIDELAPDHPTFQIWRHNNSVIASWLLNSLSKEMQTSVLHYTSAYALWNDIKERFEQQNGP